MRDNVKDIRKAALHHPTFRQQQKSHWHIFHILSARFYASRLSIEAEKYFLLEIYESNNFNV